MSTPDDWQDESQDESLSQQTQRIGLNTQASQFTPQATAQSFQPPQYYQQYGAYNQGQYQNQQQYNQPQGQHNYAYNQQYGMNSGPQAFGQYGQGYGQQGYAQQNWQQQQQPQQQQQANYGYQQQHDQPPRPIQITKKPTGNEPAPSQPLAAPAKPAADPKLALKPKVLSITGDTKPKQAKTLSIGADGGAKIETAGKTKVLHIGPKVPTKSDEQSAPTSDSKSGAAKAVEKTGEATAKAKTSAAEDSQPRAAHESASGDKPAAKPVAVTADTVAKEQEEVMDAKTLRELYGKEHVNVLFIGHVDHGKSTLGGSILVASGMIDDRTLEKLKREAQDIGNPDWFLSFALDSTAQERAQGKTVEVGRAFFETDKRRYTILDAPGHAGFVPHMIEGAAQADVGVLVVSAREGELDSGLKGQTQEHARIARSQGLMSLIVAINKMDYCNWDQEKFKAVKMGITKAVMDTYKPKELTFMPISGQKIIGVKDRIPKELAPWYKGPSLLEHLDNMESLARKVNAPLMMPVSAKYRDLGTIIEGKIEAGVLKKSDTYLLMPGNTTVSISALYGETEEEVQQAICGDQVRIRLRGAEEEEIQPGFVLCSPKRPVNTVSLFEAQITLTKSMKGIITHASKDLVMHIHSCQVDVIVDDLVSAYGYNWWTKSLERLKKKPTVVKFDNGWKAVLAERKTAIETFIEKYKIKDAKALREFKERNLREKLTTEPIPPMGPVVAPFRAVVRLQIKDDAKICVEPHEYNPRMGSFTLRTIHGVTIAIGKIIRLIADEDLKAI